MKASVLTCDRIYERALIAEEIPWHESCPLARDVRTITSSSRRTKSHSRSLGSVENASLGGGGGRCEGFQH